MCMWWKQKVEILLLPGNVNSQVTLKSIVFEPTSPFTNHNSVLFLVPKKKKKNLPNREFHLCEVSIYQSLHHFFNYSYPIFIFISFLDLYFHFHLISFASTVISCFVAFRRYGGCGINLGTGSQSLQTFSLSFSFSRSDSVLHVIDLI